jgi:8-oxo-dGTP pyrophosphatase MutT (NUDIX family)
MPRSAASFASREKRPGMAEDSHLQALAAALAEHQPHLAHLVAGADQTSVEAPLARASVALVVRPEPSDLELLVIKRATRSGDPWSGHMAFPGGRRSDEDRSPRETAERETWEEVGIALSRQGRLLGGLDEVWPRAGAPAIIVSPFVFSVPAGSVARPNAEVAAAFWIPLRTLAAPGAATEYLHALASGEELRFPAIAYESHVIWGLTHRIMTGFLEVVRQAIAAEEEAR